MEIGLRIFALLLDLGFGFGSSIMIMYVAAWILDKLGKVGFFLSPLVIVLFLAWPLLYLSIPTGLWGKTLGKWICRLSVQNGHGQAPGFWQALGREVLKILAIASMIGALFVLFQLIYQGTTWYDQLCGTYVSYTAPIRLTQTQKNFRKIVKNR